VSVAHAQVQRSGGGGEMQKIMQQYQQVAAEKTALQAQVTQLQGDLATSKTALAAAQKERDALKAQLAHAAGSAATVAQLTASKNKAEESLEQYKAKLTEIVDKFRQMAATLRDVETERAQFHRELDERSGQLDKCAEDNLQLYEITGEVLDRYEHVGLFTRVSASEPFTRITRTRIENLVDEYRERAQALRVKKQPQRPPQQPASPPTPQAGTPQQSAPQPLPPQRAPSQTPPAPQLPAAAQPPAAQPAPAAQPH
jgi:chromosome segregation ATPase